MPDTERKLLEILKKTTDGQKIRGACFAVKKGEFNWLGAAGDLTEHQPYFIASTTKLFTTALILALKSKGKLDLNDKIGQYLDEDLLRGLHVFKGKDHSGEIRIIHLLAHSSGLPDYFQGKVPGGISLESEILNGHDQSWNLPEVLERTRNIPALFLPGTKNKAHYSDTNFQLLGAIAEKITGNTFDFLCRTMVTEPIGLQQTWLYTDPADDRPKNLYYRDKVLRIPLAMRSFGPDGGIVSTSSDMLIFLEAFFSGRLFPAEYLPELQKWNRIFFPLRSGIGIHLFKLPWILNPLGSVPEFIGHSGLSGALAFICPEENLLIAGTVNQVAHPDVSFRTMIKLAMALKNR